MLAELAGRLFREAFAAREHARGHAGRTSAEHFTEAALARVLDDPAVPGAGARGGRDAGGLGAARLRTVRARAAPELRPRLFPAARWRSAASTSRRGCTEAMRRRRCSLGAGAGAGARRGRGVARGLGAQPRARRPSTGSTASAGWATQAFQSRRRRPDRRRAAPSAVVRGEPGHRRRGERHAARRRLQATAPGARTDGAGAAARAAHAGRRGAPGLRPIRAFPTRGCGASRTCCPGAGRRAGSRRRWPRRAAPWVLAVGGDMPFLDGRAVLPLLEARARGRGRRGLHRGRPARAAGRGCTGARSRRGGRRRSPAGAPRSARCGTGSAAVTLPESVLREATGDARAVLSLNLPVGRGDVGGRPTGSEVVSRLTPGGFLAPREWPLLPSSLPRRWRNPSIGPSTASTTTSRTPAGSSTFRPRTRG